MKKLVRISSLIAGGAAAPIPSRSASTRGAEVEGAVGRGVQRLASRRLGERRTDAVPRAAGDVLQIVAELRRRPRRKQTRPRLARGCPWRARRPQHRRPAFLEDDFEDVARAGPSHSISSRLSPARDGWRTGRRIPRRLALPYWLSIRLTNAQACSSYGPAGASGLPARRAQAPVECVAYRLVETPG